jgi:DNA-binding SARP family transcriptional activator
VVVRVGDTVAGAGHGAVTCGQRCGHGVGLALRWVLRQAVVLVLGLGAMVRFSVLGSVELREGARRAAVGGRRQVALLAVLLINANRALCTDQLVEAVWGDQVADAAPKRLQMAVVRLRRSLDAAGLDGGSVLQTVAGGYMLRVGPEELDAEVFLARVQEGSRVLERGDVQHARALLDEALGMWRGPALAEVAYEPFAQAEIRRLEELRLCALKARVECELRLGQHTAAVGELEGLLAAYPADERFAGQLMLALYRCGRQGDALDVYTRTRTYLSSELGLEPGPALQSLQAEILAQAPTLQWASGEPGQAATDDEPVAAPIGADDRSARAEPIGLALPRSLHAPAGLPFVGRKTELARLHELWADVCAGTRAAVVVDGEPGIGKTRLASEIARTVHGQGALVLYGRCDEGLAVPYQPFVEALRPYVNAVGDDREPSRV